MASVFTVTERDLFNFDAFCDAKYTDANCQKYGFFKVKLSEDCAGQCCSLDSFSKKFGDLLPRKVQTKCILRNPNDPNLFGHISLKAPLQDQREFLRRSMMDIRAYQSAGVSTNCCMQALETSNEAFLQHFFSTLTVRPFSSADNIEDIISAARRRARVKAEAYKRRHEFQTAPMESWKRCIETAMISENLNASSSNVCKCRACREVLFNPHITQDAVVSAYEGVDGFTLYADGIEESQVHFLYLTNHFAMNHLCFTNMLADLDSVYGGISSPSLYLGGRHSYFPLHIEDISCWSFNFLLHGAPKFWIIVPPTSVSRLTDAIHRRGYNASNRWCRNSLQHKYFLPTPQFFREEDIPYEMVVQHAGEGIVVFPNAAHTGGNLGSNLAQACNFGSKKWLPYGCVAPRCRCLPKLVHADLEDLVAVHEPKLLRAYISNEVQSAVDDDYFRRSTVVTPKDSTVLSKITKRVERIQCPVCPVSWASLSKRYLVAHISKHHHSCLGMEPLNAFVQKYSLCIPDV